MLSPMSASGENTRVELLPGTLDLIVLRTLATMGSQHAYGIAARLEQLAEQPFRLNQGTLYPASFVSSREAGSRGRGKRRRAIARRGTTQSPRLGSAH
jgi:DNA-binding PadR family transcriptional regulator